MNQVTFEAEPNMKTIAWYRFHLEFGQMVRKLALICPGSHSRTTRLFVRG